MGIWGKVKVGLIGAAVLGAAALAWTVRGMKSARDLARKDKEMAEEREDRAEKVLESVRELDKAEDAVDEAGNAVDELSDADVVGRMRWYDRSRGEG